MGDGFHLEPPMHRVPIVPDLSLIEYNDRSHILNSRKCMPLIEQSKKNEHELVHRLEDSGLREQDSNKDSYITWRMKNSHLFNKPSQPCNQNLDHHQSRNNLTSKRSGKTEQHSTLLKRITEISERIEKGSINESDEELISEVTVCNERSNPKHDSKLYENDSNYKRVQELYGRIFPSEKLKLPQGGYHKHDSFVNENELVSKKQIVDTVEVRNHGDVKNTYDVDSVDRKSYEARGKKVNYEQGDTEDVVDRRRYINYANERSTCNHTGDRYVHDIYDDDACKTKLNSKSSRGRQCQSYCQNVCDTMNDSMRNKTTAYIQNPECSFEKKSVVNKKSLQRYSNENSCDYTNKEECFCSHCYKSKTNGCFSNKYKTNQHKHNHDILSESNSSSEDCRVSKHGCHEKYKKKKKKITVDELYKIVKLQNEQINLLQKQIDRLLDQNYAFKKLSESKQIVPLDHSIPNEGIKSSVEQKCSCQHSSNSNNINGNSNNDNKITTQGFAISVVQENSKIEQQNYEGINGSIKKCTNVSIGVMTSFVELTQKMQSKPQQFNGTSDMNRNQNDPQFVNFHDADKKMDVSEQKGKKTKDLSNARFGQTSNIPAVAEESFTLNEVDLPALPVLVNEHVPTPQCSVHIDIQDYGSTSSSSASSDESSDQESENDRECKSTSDEGRVGWTLYDNVVGQVNKILQKNGQPNEAVNSAVPVVDEVRNATVQQLRKLGVSFLDNDTSAAKRVTFDPVFNHPVDNGPRNRYHIDSNGIGTKQEVNDIPLKYLNEDQILQAAINIMNRKKVTDGNIATKPPENISPAYGNNDVSFATLKYLERYRLLPFASSNQESAGSTRQIPTAKVKKEKRHRIRHQISPHQQHFQIQYKEQRPEQIHYAECRPQNLLSNKILDITALKQQPKLL